MVRCFTYELPSLGDVDSTLIIPGLHVREMESRLTQVRPLDGFLVLAIRDSVGSLNHLRAPRMATLAHCTSPGRGPSEHRSLAGCLCLLAIRALPRIDAEVRLRGASLFVFITECEDCE